MSNCPTCNGPIIDGKCCNGTPKECLQKWWDANPRPPSQICIDAEFEAQYRDFLSWEPFCTFRQRLAAIEARAQAMDELLTAQTEAIEAGLKVAQMQEGRIDALETAVRNGCPVEVS